MSGLEGLGIVLGVLPLLVSAIEHYENVFRPFHRYKDFAPELARFQRRLLAQKTIFRSQCQLLLIPLTDNKTITEILDGKHHKNILAWSELARKLRDQLGQSAEACIATMTEMEEQLQTIQAKSEGFIPARSTSKKLWRKQFGKKLKFSISEPQIDRCISKLRDLNLDFSALSSQTSKLLSVVRSEESSPESVPVKQYQTIQQASVKFYEALEAACSTHKEHQAHVQVISPSFSKSSQAPEQQNVRFCVGLSRGHEGDVMEIHNTPVWFVVKSIIEPSSTPKTYTSGSSMEKLARLGFGLKRSASPSDALDSKKRIRAEEKQFRIDTTYQLGFGEPSSPSPSSSCPNSIKPSSQDFPCYQGPSNNLISIPNFCVEKNLCLNISKICKRPISSPDTCFGHLTKSSVTHELYMENQENHAKVSISLTKFVGNMAKRHHINQLDRVPLVERILLAKNLALAVLQFHTTPVLRPSWSGDDIVFYGLKSSNDFSVVGEHIPYPYLRVKVNPDEPHSVFVHQLSTKMEEKPIRNHYLFRLGVILLELAYEAPLRKIGRKPEQDLQSEFEIADHYSRTVAAMLGPRYARIVRKCLGCDFGQDVDLSCEKLRIAIHRSVVCELEGLVLDFEKNMSIST